MAATSLDTTNRKAGDLFPILGLLIYVIAMLIVVPRHEPWADEAQAWLLARDSGLIELMWRNLRYEGTPGLWHLLLMAPSRWMEYGVFNYISAGIAAFGIAILLFRSPFPLWMRMLLPFTFFLFFQYGVVARSYCLLIPLLFGLAAIHQSRYERPWTWLALLLLLSHVSLHGTVLAIAVTADHILRSISRQRTEAIVDWKMHVTAITVFIINTLFIYFQLRLPENISFSPHGTAFRWSHFHELGSEVLADTFAGHAAASNMILAVSLIWFLLKRQAVIFILGTIGLLLLFSIYYNPWHQGVLFLFWTYCLWRSFQADDPDMPPGAIRTIRPLVLVSILAVLVIHIKWNACTVTSDFRERYSASRDLADFIRENGYDQKRIYGNYFWSVAVLPYFGENIYYNYQYRPERSFWPWTLDNDWEEPTGSILAGNPDLIILPKPHLYPYPEHLPGYSDYIEFKGSIFWKCSTREYVIYRVFERR